MADKFELIRGMDGEWRKWRETGPNVYAEEVAIVDGLLAIAAWPEDCLEICGMLDVLYALGDPSAGVRATGTVQVDEELLTPAGPYQTGDRLTVGDGVRAATFEFYTASAPSIGRVSIGAALAQNDTLTVTEWQDGLAVTFAFVDDPPTYAGPHTPVQRVVGDLAATAQHLLAALQNSLLDLTAAILAGDPTTVWIINNLLGAGGNVPLVVQVAAEDPDTALVVEGLSAGADSTLAYVLPGNVPVAGGANALVNLRDALDASALQISSAIAGATLHLTHDLVGVVGNVLLVVQEEVAGAISVTGLAGGLDPHGGILALMLALLQLLAAQALPDNQIVTLVLADTEYPVQIPASLGYEFRARGNVELRYAYTAGRVAAPDDPYLTLEAGEQYHVNARLAAHTLYLATATPGTIVELLVYEV